MKRILACALACAATAALAEEVSLDTARTAAQNWASCGYSMKAFDGRTVASAETIESGGAKMHVVSFAGGGYVVLAADDLVDPVIAFSPTGKLRAGDAKNPLLKILKADLGARQTFVSRAASGRRARLGEASASRTATQKRWDTLVDGPAAHPVLGSNIATNSVSEVRVDPFVASRWGQDNNSACWDEEGYTLGYRCFNFWVPNYYSCGCSATALAQVLRFYEYPTSVPSVTRTCWVDGVAGQYATKGSYDYSKMPLVPEDCEDAEDYGFFYAGGATVAERMEIGKLTYDAAVSLSTRWSYEAGGSTFGGFAFEALTNVFRYANARAYLGSASGVDMAIVRRLTCSNLDAGHPVILAMDGKYQDYDENDNEVWYDFSHVAVADGYGYSDNQLYLHFNMGWCGDTDAWYLLPDCLTEDGWYLFTLVTGVVYNIFPTQTGDILSGRVTDPEGSPVPGETVTVLDADSSVVGTAKTNERGIYSFLLEGGSTYTVSVGSELKKNTLSVYLEKSINPLSVDYLTGEYTNSVSVGGKVKLAMTAGNSWGNDLVDEDPDRPEIAHPDAVSRFDGAATYDGDGHTIDTNALKVAFSEAIDGTFEVYYATSAEGGEEPAPPWTSEPPTFTNVCKETVWYKVAGSGFDDYVHAAKVTISRRTVANSMFGAIPDQIYTTQPITPEIAMTCAGRSGVPGTDYTVEYVDNVSVGTATATVTGIGNFTGSVSLNFRIRPVAHPCGDYLKLDLEKDLGVVIDADYAAGDKVTVKIDCLAEGLKLVSTPQREATGRKAVTNVVHTIEGVPSEPIDFVSLPMFARVTVTKGKTATETLTALRLAIDPAEARTLEPGILNAVFGPVDIATLWPEAAGAKASPSEWTFKGWPAGLKYNASARPVAWTYRVGGVTVRTNAPAWTVYGVPTKVGEFALSATRKYRPDGATSAVNQVREATMTVWPNASETDYRFVDRTGITTRNTSLGADVKSVSGLPDGLRFSGGKVSGTPTREGVFTVALVKSDKTKESFLWLVEAGVNDGILGCIDWPAVDSVVTVTQDVAVSSWTIDIPSGGMMAVSDLPPGLEVAQERTTGKLAIVGTPTKAGCTVITFTTIRNGITVTERAAIVVLVDESVYRVSASLDGVPLEPWVSKSETHAFRTNVWTGVYLEWPVAASALTATSVKVSGLPAGLKFDGRRNVIYGAPSAASKTAKDKKTGTVTVTPSAVKVTVATAGKRQQVFEIDATVDPLPGWVVGTFAGPSYDGCGAAALPDDIVVTNGLAAVSIASSGKISAKQPVDGKSASFAAKWFDLYDADENAFYSTLTAKVGKQVVTNEMAVCATPVLPDGGSVVTNGCIESDRFDAWQYNWKIEPWKTLVKPLDKQTSVYYVDETGAAVDAWETAPALGADGIVGKVTLKFASSGAVKVAGEFVQIDGDGNAVLKKGLPVTVKASASATLVPVAGADEAVGCVFVYLAPKGLSPHVRCLEIPLEYPESGGFVFRPAPIEPIYVCYKPVIYLYPEEDTVCRVRVTTDRGLTCTYPACGPDGWCDFVASSDGTLTFPDARQYYCLFWEGETGATWDYSYGYCVKGSETGAFLADMLPQMGLSFREANEFIVYWLPRMQDNAYNVISFQGENYASAARLEVSPAPDSVLRIFMAWHPSASFVDIPAPVVAPFARTGFTVVEWGGAQTSD